MARAAEWRLNEFGAQDLANITWALVKSGQLYTLCLMLVSTKATWTLIEFQQEGTCMTLWALSRSQNLTNAWNLLEHANREQAWQPSCHCVNERFSAAIITYYYCMLRRRDRFWGCGCWVGLLCETMGFHTATPPSSHCARKSCDVIGVFCGLLVFCFLFFGGVERGGLGARGQYSVSVQENYYYSST